MGLPNDILAISQLLHNQKAILNQLDIPFFAVLHVAWRE
jgi:hypothetical protein